MTFESLAFSVSSGCNRGVGGAARRACGRLDQVDETVTPEAAHQLAVMLVETVGQLRDGLSAIDLDELAARLSGTFWSMSRNDQVALLAEATAELRRHVPASGAGLASAPGVIFDLGDDLAGAERWLSSVPDESVRTPRLRFAGLGGDAGGR